jgi:hypothetical protein
MFPRNFQPEQAGEMRVADAIGVKQAAVCAQFHHDA